MNDNLKQREQELEAEALRINAGRKPKFGDRMRNPWASESNPTRDGYFVQRKQSTPRYGGPTYELTDGNGKFWKTSAKYAFFIDDARATPAQPVPPKHVWMLGNKTSTFICGSEEAAKEMHRALCPTPTRHMDIIRVDVFNVESKVQPSPSSVGAAKHDAERIRAEVDWENGLTQLLEGYKHAADHGICSRESIQQNIIDYVLAQVAPSIAQDGQKSEGANG